MSGTTENKTIKLRSGAGMTYATPTLTLGLVCDVVDLTPEDRDFIFGIVDSMKEYENPTPKPEPVHLDPDDRKMELGDTVPPAKKVKGLHLGQFGAPGLAPAHRPSLTYPPALSCVLPTDEWNITQTGKDGDLAINIKGSRDQIAQRMMHLLRDLGYLNLVF